VWIVRLALRRPYTFVVGALLLIVLGVGTVRRMPTDIFPEIEVPVISVVWTYGGMPSAQMEAQITQFSENSLSGNVEGIKAIESQTFDGAAVIKLFFHPGTDVATATSQVTAISQTIIRRMPVGTQPPVIVRYNASSVPILQLALTSDTLSDSEIFEYANRRIRQALSVHRGTRLPLPSGGRSREIVVDLDPTALRAHGLSAHEVNLAIAQQNLTLPTGGLKLGELDYRVGLNSSPPSIDALNELPLPRAGAAPLRVRDVAFVHDGFPPQTNLTRLDGQRGVVLSILKTGTTSTLDIAAKVKAQLPALRAAAPEGLRIELITDQSGFVKRAVDGLVLEGLLAAGLTAAMILLFLGSWRSTLIVAVSIPLSVLAALLILHALGYTLNVMTLGGLALAVGILVDDATVEIENIHRNLHEGKPLVRAILDGAQQVAVPALVASTAIGLVFLSVLLLEGPTRYLFLPMGLAVGLSVMASYVLSRTLVPTLVRYLLPAELRRRGRPPGLGGRVHAGFERAFAALQRGYARVLARVIARRRGFLLGFVLALAIAAGGATHLGREFFPVVDAGQIRLHVTAPSGTRIEETERWFARVEATVAELIPEREREAMVTQIGLPGGYTLATTETSNLSSSDGELLIRLAHGRTGSTAGYIATLRDELPRRFPELAFYFQPADMATQILNFGLPAPIDVQVSGQARDKTLAIARAIERELARVPGAVDVRLHQRTDVPRLYLEVDRERAALVGMTQRDVANNVLLAVGSSGQVAANYWTDPVTGQSYSVSVQIPEHQVTSMDDLLSLTFGGAAQHTELRDLVSTRRQVTQQVSSRINVQPTYNVRADVAGADLASVAAHIDRIVAAQRKALPPGATIEVRGQIASMRDAFADLGWGLALAALLVYCLMVINFQSWRSPLLIMAALPGAGAGIIAALLLTDTALSVPALMGAIMSVGVATANSILLVSFADERRRAGDAPARAAWEAARTRLRPVLMTALAMIIGMAPMALALGEGGEANAALARAVMGGLVGATITTLLVVPAVYAMFPGRAPRAHAGDHDDDELEPTDERPLPLPPRTA
jgi:multidrug efflux pump subunit AcrB